ncbi:HNH endonuclease [Anabaenopsis elenkinii]|uniref:HNH endonuclease n=1 Tax=Anabaenopsis elenkinii CCIBt3563 TaxID=2779889 RepID=A0A7S6RG44_9CYAN|nr:HNH endonuclease [Anabaenopsis elenkinii]QOV22872.1 HNH endonuclease [Anabaenopsis elenkinii CCIBt3563]
MARIYKLSKVPSSSEYITGLNAISDRINDTQIRLLQEQYYSPNRTVTSTQLAKLLSIKGGVPTVNSQYGKLGRLFCDAIGFEPRHYINDKYYWWSVWSIGHATQHNFLWEMHSEVAEALEFLGWVSKEAGSDAIFPDEVSPQERFYEGAVHKVSVNAYERDRKAREKCISHYGYSCYVCGFNFGEVFGKLGEGLIHVHHLRPLSEIGQEYEIDPIKDLRPVCPNCHAMIHRRLIPLTIEELKALVQQSKNQTT